MRAGMDATGICCFGTAGDNILMWSHYRDEHRGVCFKFDRLADPVTYQDLFEVYYRKEYPRVKLLANGNQSVIDYFSTKSEIWSYEKEWRLFSRTGPGLVYFKKESLTEILFGCRAAPQAMAAMAKLVRLDPELQHVTIQQARVSNKAYALRFDNYPLLNFSNGHKS